MKKIQSSLLIIFLSSILLSSCVKKVEDDSLTNDTTQQTHTVTQPTNWTSTDSVRYPVTLPVIDAFFADSSFVNDAKQQVGLSDSEVVKVKQLVRSNYYSLREDSAGYTSSTPQAEQDARTKLQSIIGPEKTNRLISFVQARWRGDSTNMAQANVADSSSPAGKLNAVPTDTRIVVNIPEYRMDIFDSGTLQKSYKIAIGYPEFPLPSGMRQAKTIIFNPTWTPPDELWVDTSSKYQAGKKINAGDKLNPLGILKIPIGLPSLIHGGKASAKLGTFGSHGCVGLTNDQAKEVAIEIAKLSGDSLSTKDIAAYTKTKTESKEVKLKKAVPVELRYETMVVENGKLHILRDVYGRNTNTEQNLQNVLQTYGVTVSQLTPEEKNRVDSAIQVMSYRGSKTDSLHLMTSKEDSSKTATTKSVKTSGKTSTKETASAKTKNEVVIPIQALAGKGYPEWQLSGTKKQLASETKKR